MSKENPISIQLTRTIDEVIEEAIWPTYPIYHTFVDMANKDHYGCGVAFINHSVSGKNVTFSAILTDENGLIDLNFDESYIYLVKAIGKHKIGVTKNIENRISQLQTGCPEKIELIFAKKVFDAYGHEKTLHEKYLNDRVIGEWFDLEEKSINEIVSYLSKLDIVLPEIKEVTNF